MTEADGKPPKVLKPVLNSVDLYLSVGDKVYVVLREAMQCPKCECMSYLFVERIGKNARCFACEDVDELWYTQGA